MSLILAGALAAATPANAPPQHAGQCRWVHGRFVIANGSAVRRIWVIGTGRIIALYDSDEQVPPSIKRYEREGPHEDALFGDFYVCAREDSRPGWMQHVRLIRTRNLLYRGRPYAMPQGRRL